MRRNNRNDRKKEIKSLMRLHEEDRRIFTMSAVSRIAEMKQLTERRGPKISGKSSPQTVGVVGVSGTTLSKMLVFAAVNEMK
ncbi:hypothetical protein NDU88_003272 [Pleurodeles waltl]|uniref:Uncharacterized protein n=1 Tax=Pleurodeles waltl TaxID=8319 RepID=A0AAV7NIS1_PLEWA|nr:hypothetical protein NDU88_003272 [Pleurodeles waltl]